MGQTSVHPTHLLKESSPMLRCFSSGCGRTCNRWVFMSTNFAIIVSTSVRIIRPERTKIGSCWDISKTWLTEENMHMAHVLTFFVVCSSDILYQKEFETVYSLVKELLREKEVTMKKRSRSEAGLSSEIVNLEDEESCESNRTGSESGKFFQECVRCSGW